jgi:hypothetical protein
LLDAIRPLVDKRPAYGYRRIMALLNREGTNAGLSRLNHKRIYRVMRAANLLLQPCTGKRIDRVHDGVVQTLRSNMRWCSDGFEIHCWNGEIVRIATKRKAHFSTHASDRFEALFTLALDAGMRQGELFAPRWREKRLDARNRPRCLQSERSVRVCVSR